MAAPLSKTQKRYLSQLSDRAYNRLAALARGRGGEFPPSPLNGERAGVRGEISDSALRKEFRHDEVAKACGKLGLRCCSQDDYSEVKAHFLHLLGEDGRAFKEHVHAQSNGRRVAEHKIVTALGALGKGMPYAEALCHRMFGGTGLMDASERQLWKLFFALQFQVNRQSRRSRAPTLTPTPILPFPTHPQHPAA